MSDRMRKVDEVMRQVLSEEIPTLKDPRIGFVTLTRVETTSDFDQARVFVSVYGSEKQRDATLQALESAAGVLQARIGRQLRLRRTPRLSFVYDRAIGRGVEMTKLIDELAPTDDADTSPERETDGAD
jgi:ribosome-binding factor A